MCVLCMRMRDFFHVACIRVCALERERVCVSTHV